MHSIRIYQIPDCKMVSSGVSMFGEGKFERFNAWFSSLPIDTFSKDYLFWDDSDPEHNGFHWLYRYEPDMQVPEEFSVIDFTGGLYAVATDIDGKTDTDAMNIEIDRFLKESGFIRDNSRPGLGNIITPPQAAEVLGYHQMDYFFPIKPKTEAEA